jgi:hypothetical protein
VSEQEIDTAAKRLAAHHASVGWPTDQVILGLARDITSLADALASDDAVSRGYRQAHDIVMAALERNERNRQARAGKAAAGLPETMTQPVSFDATIDPPAGKAATGERHEFVGDGALCALVVAETSSHGRLRCNRPADAAVHQTTTEDNK